MVPGQLYGYRLGIRSGEVEQFHGEVWLLVPRELAMALDGPTPNPAEGDLLVPLALPAADPATLELLDIAGRRWAVREVGSLGPARHVLNLGSSRRLPAGLYILALTQGDRSLTRRATVVH